MRKVTFYFLIAEALDILTTMIGLSLGLKEANPLVWFGWGWVIFIKTISIVIPVIVLEIKKPRKFDVLVIVVIIPFVIWNVINIISVVIYP